MILHLIRFHSGADATLGSLFNMTDKLSPLWMCYTLEDEFRDVKIRHETRIPAGDYRIEFRNEGGMTKKYAKTYSFHKGMLWLRHKHSPGGYVEDWGWKWVYLHTGNTDDDTSGCPLVGLTQSAYTMTVTRSRDAYRKIYPLIADELSGGKLVELKVVDFA